METQKPHTGVGPLIDNSYASRHFFFEIDKEEAKQYNKVYKIDKKFSYIAPLIGIAFLALAIWLYPGENAILRFLSLTSLIIGGSSLILGIILMIKKPDPTAPLKRGVLNPAIISQIDENGIGLLVLVEVTRGANPKWGFYSIILDKLPTVHEVKVGERVPVTCTFSTIANLDYFNNVFIVPISWGTKSKDVINQAISSINEIEWNVLESNINRFDFQKHYTNERRLQRLTEDEIYRYSLDKVSG